MAKIYYVSSDDRKKSLNQYIVDVIETWRAPQIKINDYRIRGLISHIEDWAGRDLADVFVSGSSAKGTALIGSSDLDLFISLKSGMTGTLYENYHSLAKYIASKNIKIRLQNVSIRATFYGLKIDLVPGKKKPNQVNWHFLHTNRRDDQYRIQTNVSNHVNYVLDSGRVREIMALKIWRELHKLDFPSMYLEMYAIKALSGKWSRKIDIADNFLYVLEHIAKYFRSTAIYDPSNRSNIISDSLYAYEKKPIQTAAERSMKQEFLDQILRVKRVR
jgi:predicted nucleotidyltransferase